MKFPKRKTLKTLPNYQDEYLALEAEALNRNDLNRALQKSFQLLERLKEFGIYSAEDYYESLRLGRSQVGVGMYSYAYPVENYRLVDSIIFYINQALKRMESLPPL